MRYKITQIQEKRHNIFGQRSNKKFNVVQVNTLTSFLEKYKICKLELNGKSDRNSDIVTMRNQ